MDKDTIICGCFEVSYGDIRKAMSNGALTIEAIMEETSAGSGCGSCIEDIEEILASACSCFDVSVAEVKAAVREGASTVAEVGHKVKAGTGCGRCQNLVGQIIADTK